MFFCDGDDRQDGNDIDESHGSTRTRVTLALIDRCSEAPLRMAEPNCRSGRVVEVGQHSDFLKDQSLIFAMRRTHPPPPPLHNPTRSTTLRRPHRGHG